MARVGGGMTEFGDYGRWLLALLGLTPAEGCPRCGSPRLVELVYGVPGSEALEAARAGLVRLGGLLTEWEPPELSCLDCGADVWPDGRWRGPAELGCGARPEVAEGARGSGPGDGVGRSGWDPEVASQLVAELALVALVDGPAVRASQRIQLSRLTLGRPAAEATKTPGPEAGESGGGERV